MTDVLFFFQSLDFDYHPMLVSYKFDYDIRFWSMCGNLGCHYFCCIYTCIVDVHLKMNMSIILRICGLWLTSVVSGDTISPAPLAMAINGRFK